jgi:hypothetical protein
MYLENIPAPYIYKLKIIKFINNQTLTVTLF